MPKEIILNCYEPIARFWDYPQLWADVWVRYKAKPGRRVYQFAPTLTGYDFLIHNLEACLELQKKRPDLVWLDDIEHFEMVIDFLKHEEFYIDYSCGLEMPEIWTRAKRITRPEAERMLDFFLDQKRIGKRKYKWKRPDLIVIPT